MVGPAKPKTTTAKAAPKAAAKTPASAAKKKPKVVLPKNVKKLITHRSTRPLWAKIRRTAKSKKVPAETLLFFFGFKHHFF
ncbi:unnamed protein product [Medioppia subpectinata]|uniref:Uncharacterized protein n=1 Tax=Medioppia subpectinata TaxID=1979941 RepID=A0A7R9KCS7_9ACAR|nr:unnamed protein product [Medioppia subpectinata]CAG2101039.1 unnamed protein product [Medioppia subpectinata]